MGLEDDLARRARDRAALTQVPSDVAEFLARWADFNNVMQRNGVKPNALYEVQFSRQLRAGRPKKPPGLLSNTWRPAESGVDEYLVRPIYDVWLLGTDPQEGAWYKTETALTVDGLGIRWTTEHDLVRSTRTYPGGSTMSVEQVYVGMRTPSGPNPGAYGQWDVPASAIAPPRPLKYAPSPYSKVASDDWIADFAEYHLGAAVRQPSIHVSGF